MDRDNIIKRKTNPRETSNWLSVVTFFYNIKIFVRAYIVGLEFEDIYNIPPEADCNVLGSKLKQQLERCPKSNKIPSICKVLWICFWKKFLLIGVVQCVSTMIMTTLTPQALSKLISYFSPGQSQVTKQDAIFYTCIVISVNFVNMLVVHNCRMILSTEGINAKAAIASVVYSKCLKLRMEILSSRITSGKIVTILTKDLYILEFVFASGNNLWIAVIQTGVICYLIFRKIGILSFPGIGFFLVVLPLQIYIGILTYNYKLQCSKKTDERLDLIREVLTASKIIKMYTWEKFFEKKILKTRQEEVKKLHNMFYANVWINLIGKISSKMALFIFLTSYVWWGQNDISAEIVYYMVTCFNDLEGSLSSNIPFGFVQIAQVLAAAKRIESVLEAEEITIQELPEVESPQIKFDNVSVRMENTNILENLSLTINTGLNIVVGPTGSGKSTLLKTILQETEIAGNLQIKGKISYASQEPWLFPSSIRNNILFGEEFNEERYKTILSICCLDVDLEMLPEHDRTLIGESNINLSKGQQTRINLARAIYRNSNIYLLDDCLASLDASVSDMIFQNCICDFLKDKICVFVTNNPDYIQKTGKIIVVESKSVKFNEGFALNKKVKTNDNNLRSEIQLKEIKSNKQVYHEFKQSGRVPLKDYLKYIKYGGGIGIFALIISLFILTQSIINYSDKLLSKWITLEENVTNYKQANETDSLEFMNVSKESNHEMVLYTVMVLVSVALFLIKSFSYFYFVRSASIKVHKVIINKIMNSTMEFFDNHYIGTVINRFTTDFITVDDTLPFIAMDCFSMIFMVFGGIILLTTVNYIYLLESLVLLIGAVAVKQFCQPAGRNLERLQVIARSPLTGHINSTMAGLVTIRASQAQNIITNEFHKHQNVYSSAVVMVINNFLAINVYVRYLCSLFTSVVIIQFLITDFGGSVGDVGLAITQAFTIANIISSGVISVADCENLMVSVERILEYTTLKQENQDGSSLLQLEWPKSGSIIFKNLSLNYGDLTMLENINFHVKPKEKLAIVGRTGAGKSSLISSLFRLYNYDGTITIDGVNIKEIDLFWLRSNISVMPQDSYLFNGSIRENLDPLKQYKDEEIWDVLKELNLNRLIFSLDLKVDKNVRFSAGEKQLLSLARILLRKNKILVLDEATANVDENTDVFINNILDKYFYESTIVIIAHKLTSILKCDKVIVLSCGRIIEYGRPQELMKNANSFLFKTIEM